MSIYTVLVPGPVQTDADPMRAVFVKDGFSWPALLFGGLWLISRRLWLVLLGYLVATGLISALVGVFDRELASVALIFFQLLFGLEANELRRWTLQRHGYRLAAVVEGRGIEEAELRYFSGLSAPADPPPPPAEAAGGGAAPPPAPTAPPPLAAVAPSAEAGDVVGLFPAPGGRA